MNWSSVKNLLIMILVAANLFLVFNIIRQDRTRNYISDEEIKSAVVLLSERGLIVPRSAVPEKKFKAAVYESLYSDEYFTEAAQAMTNSERELILSLPNGSFSITAKNGETVDFDTEFGFVYSKYSTSDTAAYTDITADNFGTYKAEGEAMSGGRLKALSKKAEAFLNSGAFSDNALRAEVYDGYYDADTGYSVLLAVQSVNGYNIYSHNAVCVFSNDTLIFAQGRWYFAPLNEDYTTELRDQINILFEDLSALKTVVLLDSQSENGVWPENIPEASEEIDLEIPAVKSVNSCYVIYWGADKTALYFIPAWQVDHINGLTIVYNATNSTIYSIDN